MCPLTLLLGERVSLIDEEDPVQRIGDLFLGLQRRVTDIAGDKSGPVRFNQVAFLQHAEIAQDGAVKAGHDRLAGAGRPGEHHMQRDRRHRQTPFAPDRLDLQP